VLPDDYVLVNDRPGRCLGRGSHAHASCSASFCRRVALAAADGRAVITVGGHPGKSLSFAQSGSLDRLGGTYRGHSSLRVRSPSYCFAAEACSPSDPCLMGYQRLRWRIRVANAGQGLPALALWRGSAPPVVPNLVTRADWDRRLCPGFQADLCRRGASQAETFRKSHQVLDRGGVPPCRRAASVPAWPRTGRRSAAGPVRRGRGDAGRPVAHRCAAAGHAPAALLAVPRSNCPHCRD
jgi:hypothetical protein